MRIVKCVSSLSEGWVQHVMTCRAQVVAMQGHVERLAVGSTWVGIVMDSSRGLRRNRDVLISLLQQRGASGV
jgi:hypothetical protein